MPVCKINDDCLSIREEKSFVKSRPRVCQVVHLRSIKIYMFDFAQCQSQKINARKGKEAKVNSRLAVGFFIREI